MIDATYNEELYLVREKPVVILSKPWTDITSAESEQLQKILQALRLKLASVRIVYQPTLDASKFNSRVIYFGAADVSASGNVVQAPSLAQLQNDPAAKQKLWVALKALFGL